MLDILRLIERSFHIRAVGMPRMPVSSGSLHQVGPVNVSDTGIQGTDASASHPAMLARRKSAGNWLHILNFTALSTGDQHCAHVHWVKEA